jgi:polyisoprenoid-binding protein YceI
MTAPRLLRTAALGLSLAAPALLAAAPASAAAPEWSVIQEESRVGFVAQQSGDPVPGEFKSFDAAIHFAKDQLASSRVDVTIRVGSVDAGSTERNQTITSPDLFHAAKHPTARFQADSFKPSDEPGRYIADGELTMRGTTHPVALPFDLDITEENGTLRAVAEGAVTVKRLRWGIGQGQWEDTSMVPNEVRIEIDITATRPAG